MWVMILIKFSILGYSDSEFYIHIRLLFYDPNPGSFPLLV